MTIQNTLVFRNISTTPFWGEGAGQTWETIAPVKSAPGYQLIDVQIDDTNAQASNVYIVPTSITLYSFPNITLQSNGVPTNAPVNLLPYAVATTQMTSIIPNTASHQALSALEAMYATQIANSGPESRIVVNFAGHGNFQSFFQGSLTTADSVKLMTSTMVEGGGALVILDTTACNQGNWAFVREYVNCSTYILASEQEVGTTATIPAAKIPQYFLLQHDETLSTVWAQGKTSQQGLTETLSDATAFWGLLDYSGITGSAGEQSMSVFTMSGWNAFVTALGSLPVPTLASFGAGTDLSGYIMASGNQALISAFQGFETGYASNSQSYNWVDNQHGLGCASLVVQDLENRAIVAAGGHLTGSTVASDLAIFAKYPNIILSNVVDTAANVQANIDALENMFEGATTGGIQLTDVGTPVITVSVSQLINDSFAFAQIYSNYSIHVTGCAVSQAAGAAMVGHVAVVDVADTVANVSAGLVSLQNLASAGVLGNVSFTDNGIPTLSLTTTQMASDAAVLKAISGTFSVTQTISDSNLTISGLTNGLGNTVALKGSANQFAITPTGDGASLTVGSNLLCNVQALQFSDCTLIVAQAPCSATVTSGNITELYAAVFGRLPDVSGLAYYQNMLKANPSLPLTLFAQDFLASPEYTGNPAHNYAQTSAGDTQFITDAYNNLLHRPPGNGDAAWYEANVIVPFLNGLTPGTTAYSNALMLAHAYVITDFSASSEFLGNVQVTGTHPADARHWLVLI